MKKLFAPILMGLILSNTTMAGIIVKDPVARAVPAVVTNSAIFLELENTANKAVSLIKAESPVSKVVELHTHLNDNGVMRMRQVEKMTVPANKSIVLKPGGLHIMLIGLHKPLIVGNNVDLTLTFSDNSVKKVTAEIVKISRPKMKMKMDHKMMMH